MIRGFVTLALVAAHALPVRAGDVVRDEPAHRDGAGMIVAAAVGMPDDRLPTMEARLASARRVAERRARSALRAYADAALGQALANPAVIARTHEVLREETVPVEVRALVDGSAIVRVAVPVSKLEGAVAGSNVGFP